jgi:predicted amidohydrolase YtcJ
VQLDTLLLNGRCYTMEHEGHLIEAIGIKDGVIRFTGSNEEALKWESKRVVDLQGKAVIPGMVDAHMHMYAYCQNLALVDLQGARSMGDMISLMQEKAKTTPKGNWIKGVNFDQSKFRENRFPTREDLDTISLDHPIVIKRCCLHAVVANSLALAKAGVDKDYRVTSGGIVEFQENGEPNGILREQATKIFDDLIPDPLLDVDEKQRIMDQVLGEMSSKGVTGIHTYAAKIWQYNEDLDLYKSMAGEGTLPLRVTVCLDELFEPEVLSEADKSNPHRLVQYGAYKLFTDGSLGSRSAALKEPYSDDPTNKGFMVCSQEDLNHKIEVAYRMGLQPAIHAIGDAALGSTLTAIEKCLDTMKAEGMTDQAIEERLPFRIIHVQMLDDVLLDRMKKLPLVLDIQPIFLCTDLNWIEDRIGQDRMKNAYAWKTLEENGFIQTGGSDCPVESYDPMLGVYAAVTRKDFNQEPSGGFYPEECLSVYQALSLFTKNPHYATGQEDVLGTLSQGKFGDLVVLDQDPFKIEPESLLNIQVLKTIVAGKEVYAIEDSL